MIICGDLNSRIGEMSDIISDIDGIAHRTAVDGHTLTDSKMCVLNGRFDNNREVGSRYRLVSLMIASICVRISKLFPLHQSSATITYSPCLENEVE